MKFYDLAIIGSGPGGYVAAIYASRLKLKTCVIEKSLTGGTCLNKGCIPTKSLINSASIISTLKKASLVGTGGTGFKVDFHKISSRKDEMASRLRGGIETLLRANKVDLIKGEASLADRNTIRVTGSDEISAKFILIATGSTFARLPGIDIDEQDIVSSDGVLLIDKLPESILVAGGGVIGCEFACLFNALGSKVTIVEFMDRLLPGQSREVSKKLELSFKKKGIDIFVSTKVEKIEKENGLLVYITGSKNVRAEKALISIGRVPCTEDLGLDKAGIKIDNGRIAVSEYLRTAADNIYAIGDCVKGPMLAHKASYDALVACDNITGNIRKADYSNIPNMIWTSPEIASVGLNEEDARARHPDIRIAKFPYLASGKALVNGSVEGFVKIMGDTKGMILGVEIFGEGACDLIAEAVLARSAGIKIAEWARVVHGHPTLSEMLQEACHIFSGTPIHSV